jgi:hypothetical protein
MASPMAPESDQPKRSNNKAKVAIELFTLTSTLVAFILTVHTILLTNSIVLNGQLWKLLPFSIVWPLALTFVRPVSLYHLFW